MQTITRFSVFVLVFALVPMLSGCDSTGPVDDGDDPRLQTVTIEDLAAGGAIDTTGGGKPAPVEGFTFYSLREQHVVDDSASTAWDIAFKATTILINGGTSGPGQGAGYVAEASLSEVKAVDESQLKVDDAEAGVFAVPPRSDSGWYHYSGRPNHVITPLPGRTIIVRTADGEHYAKIRILSYYKGAPDNPAESDAPPRYYTFEYVISDDTSF